jgi:hypothetical protein
VRRVEVPFKRQVKVPTVTHKLESTTIRKRVPIKRLVEVPSYQEVEEEYTVLTDPTLPPNADPSAVAEARAGIHRATLKVPVTRTRKVMKAVTVFQEVDDWAEVDVPASRVVECEGYRIDEVEDTKVVEVEEVQHYALQPVPVGPPSIAATQDLGRINNSRLARNRGAEVFAADHPAVAEVENDDEPDFAAARSLAANAARVVRAPTGRAPAAPMAGATLNGANAAAAYGSTFSASALARTSPFAGRPFTPSGTLNNSFYRQHAVPGAQTPVQHPHCSQYDRTGYADPKNIVCAGSYKRLANADSSTGQAPTAVSAIASVPVLGLYIKDTHTRHTEGNGVYVTKVDRGGPAQRAGLADNDLITSVQGQSVTTVEEFMLAVRKIPGPLVVQFNRDGRRSVVATLYR